MARCFDEPPTDGSMVDVLWQDGMTAAGIRLEVLWNQLAVTHRFSLLCGYAMGSFYKDAGLRDVCFYHSRVIPAENSLNNGPRARRSRSFVAPLP